MKRKEKEADKCLENYKKIFSVHFEGCLAAVGYYLHINHKRVIKVLTLKFSFLAT